MLSRQPDPVIVTSLTGVFTRRHQYLTSYKGLAFYTRSEDPLELPANAELITAKSMWMPG